MKIRHDFTKSRLNQDLDERILPQGEYPNALNVRISSSEAGDAGALVNAKGNKKLTNLFIEDAVTIGSFADTANEKVYWFLTSPSVDRVMEYDFRNKITSTLLESTKPDGVLNFDKSYLITGVNKVINGDHQKDLLIWTDGLNPPRKINIERAKTYAPDGFFEDDISLIKRPPIAAPEVTLTFDTSTTENAIEDKFLSFAYRYKYLDGEYSALSSFTYYKFAPSDFDLDFEEMVNKGMVNSFNAVNINFNTGQSQVTDIQLVVKESNSNAVAIIETFNKAEQNWPDNVVQSLKFSNNKKYIFLPQTELFRSYDNVPRTAKAMELVNNRLIFGNYEEGFDLVSKYGENIIVDYDVSISNRDLASQIIPVTFSGSIPFVTDFMTINLAGKQLVNGSSITLDIRMTETATSGTFTRSFDYILNKDYISAAVLAVDPDFEFFVETILTQGFTESYEATPPPSTLSTTIVGFTIDGFATNTIRIKCASVTYLIDGTPDFSETYRWSYDIDDTTASYKEVAIATSLKTNRSYEVGLIYLDDYNRASTVITCKDNTIRVPQSLSTSQNKILVNINHQPPADAVRYKLAIKQNKAEYQTIYTSLFYEDGLYRWVKLEGASKDKVREGDTLIVKSDLSGPVVDPIRVKVIELDNKEEDFIVGNKDLDDNDIIEQAGLYMKIKPSGFNMESTSFTPKTFEGFNSLRYPARTFTSPEFGTRDESNVFTPFPVKGGSTIRITIDMYASGSIEFDGEYDKTFRVNSDHASIKDWFDAEVVDLGQFGIDFTWNGVDDIGPNICAGQGLANSKHRFAGWGFGEGCENYTSLATEKHTRFYVVNHRKGTAHNNVYAKVKFEIRSSDGIVIFETEPAETTNDVFYETEETFEIASGYHLGNIASQAPSYPIATVEVDFFNCYVQGNGAESYRFKDEFNSKFLNIDLRPSSTSIEKFRKVKRYADLTYSAVYNENNNLNGLNEFNLATLNFKEDIDKRYGSIQKIYAHDTDLVTFQEDKVSKVLFGKDMLFNADATTNLSAIEDILGRQVMYAGEYGISKNPESFAFFGNNIYFTDAKRGVVCRLAANGIVEISQAGMTNFFKDQYKDGVDNFKWGGYDPYFDQYILHNSLKKPAKETTIEAFELVSRKDFMGEEIFKIPYTFATGTITFDYFSNGVPVKYTIDYNGEILSTGYVGDPIYDDALIALGLPPTEGLGDGTIEFEKNESFPNFATVTVEAPICGADFQILSSAVDAAVLTITRVVVNEPEYDGVTRSSSYRWVNDTYSSLSENYDALFTETHLNRFQSITGEEGTKGIPLTGSTIYLNSYRSADEEFVEGSVRKLGYYLSATPLGEGDLATILAGATYPFMDTIVDNANNVLDQTAFTFTRPSNEHYLYLIWDYNLEP